MSKQKGNMNGNGSSKMAHGYQYHMPSTGGRGHGHGQSNGFKGIPLSFRGMPDGEAEITVPSRLDPTTLQLNELNIRNTDPEFRSILDYSTQSAVYPHEVETGNYGPAKAVGSLFIYKRTSGNVGFIVLNRVGVEHWLYIVCPHETQVQLSKSYLLFNHNGTIFCIWFYSSADASRIFKFLLALGCMDGKAKTNGSISVSSLFSGLQSREVVGGQMIMDWIKSAEETKGDTHTNGIQSPTSTIYHPKPLNPTTAPIPTVLDQLVAALKVGEHGSPLVRSPAHKTNVMQTVEQIEAQSGVQEPKPEAQGFLSEMKQIEAQLKLTLKISESGPGCPRLLQTMGTTTTTTSIPQSPPNPTQSHKYQDLSRRLQDAILSALPPLQPLEFIPSISRQAFGDYLRQSVGNKEFVDQVYENYIRNSNRAHHPD